MLLSSRHLQIRNEVITGIDSFSYFILNSLSLLKRLPISSVEVPVSSRKGEEHSQLVEEGVEFVIWDPVEARHVRTNEGKSTDA
jgi:hypothetical protein